MAVKRGTKKVSTPPRLGSRVLKKKARITRTWKKK